MDFMLPVSQVYLLKYIEYDAQLLEDNIIRAAICYRYAEPHHVCEGLSGCGLLNYSQLCAYNYN